MTTERRWKIAGQWVSSTKSPYLIFRSDIFEILPLIQDESVDLIVTDPPYSSISKHRDSEKRIREYEDGGRKGTRIPRLRNWFDFIPNSMFSYLINEFYRILKPDTHCYIFCDDETSDLLRSIVNNMDGKFKWWKRIVWDKRVRGMGYHYANQHEFIVFLEKGKRKLNNFKNSSVLSFKRVNKSQLGRTPGPAEKPVDLILVMIKNSSNAGDLVLDPFCGFCPVGEAAIVCGREFLGIDVRQESVDMSRSRMEEFLHDYIISKPMIIS